MTSQPQEKESSPKTKIDPEDAMLAGIAIQDNEHLLTRNRKDFAGIPELQLETY
jgi:predicted nucleic acid-binding protein